MAPTDDTPAPAQVDPAQTRMVQELKQKSPLLSARFDPSGQFVFAGAQDNSVLRWELASAKQTALIGHKSWVRGMAFQPKEKVLFTGAYEGQIIAWPIEDDAPSARTTIAAHQGWVRALAISPDGALLASCGNDCLVKLWSTADGKLVRELAGHTSHVYNVAFHPDGQQLVSADLKGKIKHWDVAKGTEVRELDAAILYKYDSSFRADIGGIRSMAFHPDGSYLACAGITEVTNAFAGVGKPLIVLFDWKTGKSTQQLRPKEAFQGVAWGVVVHPTGFIAAVGGGNGGALWFWKPDQPESFHTLKLPTNARDLDLHPDGKRLAIPFVDGVLRIYDMTPKGPA